MNTKDKNKAKSERITVALDKPTRERLEQYRQKLNRQFGFDASVSETVASLIRVGVNDADQR